MLAGAEQGVSVECVCRKHNMIDRDDASVENTTRSTEMMCLSKTQHDVACVSARVKGRRSRPCERASFQAVCYLLFHTHFDRVTTLVTINDSQSTHIDARFRGCETRYLAPNVRTRAMLTCDRLKRIEATVTRRLTLLQRRRGERLERLGLALRCDDVDGVRAMCGLVGRSGSIAIG